MTRATADHSPFTICFSIFRFAMSSAAVASAFSLRASVRIDDGGCDTILHGTRRDRNANFLEEIRVLLYMSLVSYIKNGVLLYTTVEMCIAKAVLLCISDAICIKNGISLYISLII